MDSRSSLTRNQLSGITGTTEQVWLACFQATSCHFHKDTNPKTPVVCHWKSGHFGNNWQCVLGYVLLSPVKRTVCVYGPSFPSLPPLHRPLFADKTQLCQVGCCCDYPFPCVLGSWEVMGSSGVLDVVQITCPSTVCTSGCGCGTICTTESPTAPVSCSTFPQGLQVCLRIAKADRDSTCACLYVTV